VFFRQERIGEGGRPFRIWKFRSMRAMSAHDGRLITVAGDPRITPIGRRLRAGKLDELPQLLNVLAGEMTLVGPRPEVGRYVALYTPAQAQVLALRPGITDPASLAFIDEERRLAGAAEPERAYVEAIMPQKIALNLAYAAHASIWSDALVIARTVMRVLLR
jgi:lipopolysaccharide/colanic/teichoic acid biosynthesis glycosyltransferase